MLSWQIRTTQSLEKNKTKKLLRNEYYGLESDDAGGGGVTGGKSRNYNWQGFLHFLHQQFE